MNSDENPKGGSLKTASGLRTYSPSDAKNKTNSRTRTATIFKVSKYFRERIEMRIVIVLLAICAILYSCNNNHYIYYKYEGAVITRVDKDIGESYFYYGLYKPTDTLPSSYVDAIYRRGSDLMWAYLIFDNNKKIKLISLGDWFEKVGNDTMVTLVDYSTKENDTTVNWNLKLSGHPNVIYVDRYLPREQEENVKRKTSVKATY